MERDAAGLSWPMLRSMPNDSNEPSGSNDGIDHSASRVSLPEGAQMISDFGARMQVSLPDKNIRKRNP
jgi:hypothetical protein